jgi:hypothetical protein
VKTSKSSLPTILRIIHLAGSSRVQDQYAGTNERRLPTSCKPVSPNRKSPLQQYVSSRSGRPPFHFRGNCTNVCQPCKGQHESCRSIEATANINATTSYDTRPGQEARQALPIEVEGQERLHLRQEEPEDGLCHLLSQRPSLQLFRRIKRLLSSPGAGILDRPHLNAEYLPHETDLQRLECAVVAPPGCAFAEDQEEYEIQTPCCQLCDY